MNKDRSDIHRQFKDVDGAFREGDLEALKSALGDPADFPNCLQPFELAVGDYPLEYAIYWSPLSFIATLMEIGADPNYPDRSGFPSLIAALSSDRGDRLELLNLLLQWGAYLDQRGLNDWTPLHYAVNQHDLEAIRLLLRHGADPALRTRIDDCTTPLEDARAAGFAEAVDLFEGILSQRRGDER